jgi:excisionase family DNA binding protein
VAPGVSAEAESHLRRLVTARDLAAILAVSESKVYALAADDKIPSIRVGLRSVRFDADQVLAVLREGESA